jgi:hypothetical protein
MTTCTVEHYRDPDRPRRTFDGYTICGGCAKGLERDLHALPRLYEDLAHLHGARRHGQSSKVSGTSAPRLPIDVVVADVRADMRGTVIDWCVFAAQEARAVSAAGAQRWLSLDVGHGAGWLNFHRDFCSRQDWSPELVTAIRQARSRAVRLLNPRQRQQFAIPGADGQCVRDPDGTPCPGRLWVTIPTQEEESSLIECDTCYYEYPPMSWLRLGKQVHARKVAA